MGSNSLICDFSLVVELLFDEPWGGAWRGLALILDHIQLLCGDSAQDVIHWFADVVQRFDNDPLMALVTYEERDSRHPAIAQSGSDFLWKIMETVLGCADTVDVWNRKCAIEHARNHLDQQLLLRVRAAPRKDYLDPDRMHRLIERKSYTVQGHHGCPTNMNRHTRLWFQLSAPLFPVIEHRKSVLAVRIATEKTLDSDYEELNAYASNPDCLRAFFDYLCSHDIPYCWRPPKTAFWHELRQAV
jgi:hypothetical protein